MKLNAQRGVQRAVRAGERPAAAFADVKL